MLLRAVYGIVLFSFEGLAQQENDVANSYSNMTIRGPSQLELATYLSEIGRVFDVSPTVNGVTALFDVVYKIGNFFWHGWQVGTFMPESSFVEHPSAHLSRHFDCVVLAVAVTDGDVFEYQLINSGWLLDDYISSPAYGEDYVASPSGGNAELLCAMFGAEKAVERVEDVLRYFDDWPITRRYLLAENRHSDLMAALGLPGPNTYRT